MKRGPYPCTLLTALLAATAWPVLAASADSPSAERAGDQASNGQEGEKPQAKGDVKPLEDERTKRFMMFGKLPKRYRNDGAPKVGEHAPALKLKTLEGKKEVDLASFAGKRPVVLLFGSYT